MEEQKTAYLTVEEVESAIGKYGYTLTKLEIPGDSCVAACNDIKLTVHYDYLTRTAMHISLNGNEISIAKSALDEIEDYCKSIRTGIRI